MSKNLFYIEYGANFKILSLVIEASDFSSAHTYAYQEAKDYFYEIVGSLGVLSYDEFFEINKYLDGEDATQDYDQYVEDTINYFVETYKAQNPLHYTTFQNQGFKPERI